MSSSPRQAVPPSPSTSFSASAQKTVEPIRPQARPRRNTPVTPPTYFPAHTVEDTPFYRQAELFYLQKQINSQTPMVIVLEDGQQVEGCIEWYDRNTLKVRGRQKTLIYKCAIKYMYKLAENGQ